MHETADEWVIHAGAVVIQAGFVVEPSAGEHIRIVIVARRSWLVACRENLRLAKCTIFVAFHYIAIFVR